LTSAHHPFVLLRQDFFMPYTVYIIYSQTLDQYYIGQSENLTDRLYRHSNSGSKSTKKANDWVLKYTQTFSSRYEAIKRELEIKKKKSRKYIEFLISSVA
jgi:putative endonuclease